MVKVGNAIFKFARFVDVFFFTGSYVNGVWVQSVNVTKLQIPASLQEVDGELLSLLPEGSIISQVRAFYTKSPLPIDDYQYSSGQNTVNFVINQKVYKMIAKKEWLDDYFVYLATELRQDNAIAE